jgi:hypothetical protein
MWPCEVVLSVQPAKSAHRPCICIRCRKAVSVPLSYLRLAHDCASPVQALDNGGEEHLYWTRYWKRTGIDH